MAKVTKLEAGDKVYKALVKDGGKVVTVSGYARTKREFIHDLRKNGYTVCDYKVKEASTFDYIVAHTDMRACDWRETRKVPV